MLHRPIQLESAGQTLRGTAYLAAEDRRLPTTVLMHGFGGHRIETGFMFVQLARGIAEAGQNAVTFDFRGSGESDGAFSEMLVSGEIADANRVLEWVGTQPFADRARVAAIGFSLGGLVAACASAGPLPLRALVLIAPGTVESLRRHAGDPGARRSVQKGPHTLHPDFFEDLKNVEPLQDVVRFPRPTLLVQGRDDKAVPPEVSHQYVDALRRAGIPVEAQTIDGADHGFSTPPTRQALVDAVTGFLKRG